jgi:hypothetical protein
LFEVNCWVRKIPKFGYSPTLNELFLIVYRQIFFDFFLFLKNMSLVNFSCVKKIQMKLVLILFLIYLNFSFGKMLLIVGNVEKTNARILYEAEPSTENKTISVELFQGEIKIKTYQITLKMKPQIITFQNLTPDTFYKAIFDSTEITTFTTFPPENVKKKMKIIVVSCDRYFEDGDDSFWKQLAANEDDRMGMIHLGDQIYADQITKEFRKNKTLTYEELLEKFRGIYRITWSHPAIKKILRKGLKLFLRFRIPLDDAR